MSQHDHLLKQLCGSSVETLERARELLYTSTVKTAPGSGFQLKDPLGRPAACALIASEQLKNTVVDPASAQGNSCLNPTAFRKCLAEVRAALAHDASNQPITPTQRRQTRSVSTSRVSYDSLVARYALSQTYGDRFVGWCQRAEFAFFDLGKGNNIARDSPKLKYGIFFWVCGILEPGQLDLLSFVKDSGPYSDNTRSISKVMDVYGTKIRTLIMEESRRPNDAVIRRSSTRISPGKRMTREAPSKDSPKKQKLSTEDDTKVTTPQKQPNTLFQAFGPPTGMFPPSISPRKSPLKPSFQKLLTRDHAQDKAITQDSDVEMSLPQTPSKTSHRATSSGGIPHIPATSPFPMRRSDRLNSTTVSPSKSGTLNPEKSLDSADKLHTVRKRFRPVFLDRKQWGAQDPTLYRLNRRIEQVALV